MFFVQHKEKMTGRRTTILAGIAGFLLGFNSAFAVSVQEVVDQVSQTTYRYYLDDVLYTRSGDDRGFGPEHDLARDNIYTYFDSFGLSTSYHPFQYNSNTYNNVVGVRQGTVRPDDIYIIGSHYDSTGTPGADDNGSGTAGVMEAARVLSQYDFEATLIFIAFDREEQGLHGSRAYAQAHNSDNILGMISMDMIAYNGSGSNTARIYGRQSSDPLKQALAEAIQLYGNGLSSVDAGVLGRSDHDPFQDEDFQAALLIEYDVFNNPYYHKVTDSVDTLNYIDYEFASDMVRSSVGFLADSAVLIPEPATICLMVLGCLVLLKKRKV